MKKYKKISDITPVDYNKIFHREGELNIEYYRTPDDEIENHKKQYDTEIPSEMIIFSDRVFGSNVFIQFPNNPYFFEIPYVGFSSTGNRKSGSSIHPRTECGVNISVCGENVVVDHAALDIFFMKKVEIPKNLGDRFYLEMPDIYTYEYVFDVSKMEFGKKYLLIARPVWNYSYEKLKAFLVDEGGSHVEMNIDNVGRARDGGTTKFSINNNGVKISLHIDTPFKSDRKCMVNNVEVELVEDTKLIEYLLEGICIKNKSYLKHYYDS
jgi:hypothetical protein